MLFFLSMALNIALSAANDSDKKGNFGGIFGGEIFTLIDLLF